MNFHCVNDQDIHYRDSVTFQGVKLCNQRSKENTIWVRGHSYLQSVREFTDHAIIRDYSYVVGHQTSFGFTNPSLDSDPDKLPMIPCDEVGHSLNCGRSLLQPSFCRQDQRVPIQLESPDWRQLGSRSSNRGISHSSHIQSCSAGTTI